jgi:NTE family protein
MLVTGGDTGHAVQASSSIPGVFVPVQSIGRTFSDGGALALVPVHFVQAMGADIVIAVDVWCGARQPVESNMVKTLLAVARLQSCDLSRAQTQDADILIQPDFEPGSIHNFDSRAAAIEAGYAATLEVIPLLRRLLEDDRPVEE